MIPQPIERDTAEVSEAAAGVPAQSGGFLRAIFGRHLMDMALLLVVIVAFSGLRQPDHLLADPDIWWHLADARILFTTHHFIHIEPYSFTVAGERWVNPEWLSEVPYWLGYRGFGLVGIFVVTYLSLSANVIFLYWRGRLMSRNAGVALWLAVLGFVLMWVNASARTILIGYIALSAEMAILEAAERGKMRLLWLLPALFCVWINLHGSWIIGLAVFVLYLVCGLARVDIGMFQQSAFTRGDRNRLLAVLSASLAGLFINPYGWRLIWNPFDMAMNQKLNIANVLEWQPLSLSGFVGKAAVLAIGLMVVANALRGRKWKIYEMALVFFAWYSAFNHARFTFLAAVLTIPLLGVEVTRAFFPVTEQEQKTIPFMNGVVAALALCVVAWYFPNEEKMRAGLAGEYPLQTIASIQPGWRTLNEEHLGGIMDFNGKSTFVDTRWDTFEHHGIMKDFIDLLRARDSLKILDKYRIDHVLLRYDETFTYLLERTPGWRAVRTEGSGQDRYELFVRVAAEQTPADSHSTSKQVQP
jgi:hypothetical protein